MSHAIHATSGIITLGMVDLGFGMFFDNVKNEVILASPKKFRLETLTKKPDRFLKRNFLEHLFKLFMRFGMWAFYKKLKLDDGKNVLRNRMIFEGVKSTILLPIEGNIIRGGRGESGYPWDLSVKVHNIRKGWPIILTNIAKVGASTLLHEVISRKFSFSNSLRSYCLSNLVVDVLALPFEMYSKRCLVSEYVDYSNKNECNKMKREWETTPSSNYGTWFAVAGLATLPLAFIPELQRFVYRKVTAVLTS